jgi:hypothetical protein
MAQAECSRSARQGGEARYPRLLLHDVGEFMREQTPAFLGSGTKLLVLGLVYAEVRDELLYFLIGSDPASVPVELPFPMVDINRSTPHWVRDGSGLIYDLYNTVYFLPTPGGVPKDAVELALARSVGPTGPHPASREVSSIFPLVANGR